MSEQTEKTNKGTTRGRKPAAKATDGKKNTRKKPAAPEAARDPEREGGNATPSAPEAPPVERDTPEANVTGEPPAASVPDNAEGGGADNSNGNSNNDMQGGGNDNAGDNNESGNSENEPGQSGGNADQNTAPTDQNNGKPEQEQPAPAQWEVSRVLKVTKPLMEGEDVKALQLALIANGYHCGVAGASGIFEKYTAYAVRCFQSSHGLIVDGKAGRFTVAALGGVWKG